MAGRRSRSEARRKVIGSLALRAAAIKRKVERTIDAAYIRYTALGHERVISVGTSSGSICIMVARVRYDSVRCSYTRR